MAYLVVTLAIMAMLNMIEAETNQAQFRKLVLLISIIFSSPIYAENNGLIFTPEGQAFNSVISGVTEDLVGEIAFKVVVLNRSNVATDIEKHIETHSPKIIVLVGNNALKLYSQYQNSKPNNVFPPSVAVAALHVDRYLASIKNSIGVRYEIPAVTSIVNMRSVISSPIKRVGVVHRAWMTSIVEENSKDCRLEGVELVSVSIPNKDTNLKGKLKSALISLINNNVDAIWMLNDNALLNSNMIRAAWLPALGKAKLPVIAGIESIVSLGELNLASFAATPDHYGLGLQAASIIEEIMERKWQVGSKNIEQPISVKNAVNTSVLNRKEIKYDQNKLSMMNRVFQ